MDKFFKINILKTVFACFVCSAAVMLFSGVILAQETADGVISGEIDMSENVCEIKAYSEQTKDDPDKDNETGLTDAEDPEITAAESDLTPEDIINDNTEIADTASDSAPAAPGTITFITPDEIEEGTQAGSAASCDLNGDGIVNEEDARILLMHIYFPKKYKLGSGIDCDLNADGVVDDGDVAVIMLFMNDSSASFQEAERVLNILNNSESVYISNCGKDENGKYSGGKAGDQTGEEWNVRKWYRYSSGWSVVLRYNGERKTEVTKLIAQSAYLAAQNDNIGYDQSQRGTFWTQLAASNYNPACIYVPCEADCSSGVAAVVKAVGYILGISTLKNVSSGMYTGNEKSVLAAAGFEILYSSDYLNSPDYLNMGDILLSEGHHTCIVLTDGKNSHQTVQIVRVDIKKGSKNDTVTELQLALNDLGYTDSEGKKLSADGSFGTKTEEVLIAFQNDYGVNETRGICNANGATWEVIDELLAGWSVRVINSEVNCRKSYDISSEIIASASIGTVLTATRSVTKTDTDGEERTWVYIPSLGGWISALNLKKI